MIISLFLKQKEISISYPQASSVIILTYQFIKTIPQCLQIHNQIQMPKRISIIEICSLKDWNLKNMERFEKWGQKYFSLQKGTRKNRYSSKESPKSVKIYLSFQEHLEKSLNIWKNIIKKSLRKSIEEKVKYLDNIKIN